MKLSLYSPSNEELGLAYRRAKTDLFFSSRDCREDLLEFEKDLVGNLTRLGKKIEEGKPFNFDDDSWDVIPHGFKNDYPIDGTHSEPWTSWKSTVAHTKPQVEFRIMEHLSVEFHVLAALWISEVGALFEDKLRPCARGNRLRRTRQGTFNGIAQGSCTQYFHAYRRWRENGMTAASDALEAGKKIVTISSDFTSFYHSFSPGFLLDPDFHESIGVELSLSQTTLNAIFVRALIDWANTTPLNKGLPVGLTASSVIANLALHQFDEVIEKSLTPIYYGRYVDDIILVLENYSEFETKFDLWNWVTSQTNSRITATVPGEAVQTDLDIVYHSSFKSIGKLAFSPSKTKSFFLEGSSGKNLLKTLNRQIQERNSEWRSLPEVPEDEASVQAGMIEALDSSGDAASALQGIENLTIKRSAFAMQLRDFEAYERALSPSTWQEARHAFLDGCLEQLFVPQRFFTFQGYIPRILQVALKCRDLEHLWKLIKAIESVFKTISKNGSYFIKGPVSKKAAKKLFGEKWRNQLKRSIKETITGAFPAYSEDFKPIWNSHWDKTFDLWKHQLFDTERDHWWAYFCHDLASEPLRLIENPHDLSSYRVGINFKALPQAEGTSDFLPKIITEGVSRFCEVMGCEPESRAPIGILFRTRPHTIDQLYHLISDAYSLDGVMTLQKIILAMRGYNVESGGFPQQALTEQEGHRRIVFPSDENRTNAKIAVTSFLTEDESWVASFTEFDDPDQRRFFRINRLLNQILKADSKPHYVVFPELSIPPQWFHFLAKKLLTSGTSLVAGIEYLKHKDRDVVHNQVWAALIHDGFGYPSYSTYCQDKEHPAKREREELERIANLRMEPRSSDSQVTVLDHHGLQLSLLICSELTNIQKRAKLRGKVDALFVVEWNPDTETFNALVESSALDVHAYIVQCNNRTYGDSRIRAPFKNAWERDLVRVKGGQDDYFVVGSINIDGLRAFQSSLNSPDKPYKPIPEGFANDMDTSRKRLPETP